jgi:hypothetical protein
MAKKKSSKGPARASPKHLSFRRYRVLSEQGHSVILERQTAFRVRVGEYQCSVFFRPSNADPSRQRILGGTIIHLEFESKERDIVRAASLGVQLTEDVLAGLALITGVHFGGVKFIQLVDATLADQTPFLLSLTPHHRHTDEQITSSDLTQLQGVLAHCDYLPNGGRLRRAAALYRRGIQQEDDVSAFQFFFMGLEALEPALAEQLGVNSGFEEITGKCVKCGAEYLRRRTVLNAVRAYIRGAQHSQASIPQREAEWKAINTLRHNQFHSLEDLEKLQSDARDIVPAAAHFLHDSLCCLSHAHSLESPTFKMLKGAKQLLLKGTAEPGIDDTLEKCRTVVDLGELGWDAHPDYGFVPRMNILHRRPGVEIGGYLFWLRLPLQLASENDLDPARFEPGKAPIG